MADDAELPVAGDLTRLIEQLARDPTLLAALATRLSRRKTFQRQLAEAMEDTPPAGGVSEGDLRSSPAVQAIPSARPPQAVLDRSVVSSALIDWIQTHRSPGTPEADQPFPVIVDLNLQHSGTRQETASQLQTLITQVAPGARVNTEKSRLLPQYLFVSLTRDELTAVVRADATPADEASDAPHTQRQRTMHRVWPDFPLQATLHKTGATIKAEAARVSFAAGGQDIVWAVFDSGIDQQHPHFKHHDNLSVAPLEHKDFTGQGDPLTDDFGHGTHVAGIIAGAWPAQKETDDPQWRAFHAMVAFRDEDDIEYRELPLLRLSGVAPQCKLVSYKVLDAQGKGNVSNLLAAIASLQEVNGNGKLLQIHGVNISIGHGFDPEWFACGQSPLCVEVDRLVRSGVVVVVAAGNTGYGTVSSKLLGPVATTLALTINDPGNAELAITVGAAHRESPHQYGVSYFSSKGPTGDGRLKPDLVAPGERVLSCAAGSKKQGLQAKGQDADYLEDSGTSMAAPHVSGAAAAFLSVQREFIGRPEDVKRILMATATDLGRHRDFQGAGMVDVMRAIQSV